MVDNSGVEIKAGDVIRGRIYGLGGLWIDCGIVRDTENGLMIELEGHRLVSFHTHPKFNKEARREIIPQLPFDWNAIDKWNRENGAEHLIPKCKYCDGGENA
jgi:hypothetical protein